MRLFTHNYNFGLKKSSFGIKGSYCYQPPLAVAQAHRLTIRPTRAFRFSNLQSDSM